MFVTEQNQRITIMYRRIMSDLKNLTNVLDPDYSSQIGELFCLISDYRKITADLDVRLYHRV